MTGRPRHAWLMSLRSIFALALVWIFLERMSYGGWEVFSGCGFALTIYTMLKARCYVARQNQGDNKD